MFAAFFNLQFLAKHLFVSRVDQAEEKTARIAALIVTSSQGSSELIDMLLGFEDDESRRNLLSASVPSRRPFQPHCGIRYTGTALHIAALRGHFNVVNLLLTSGAEVDIEDVLQRTPLYMASNRGRLRSVQILLASGADPNHADEDGETPFLSSSGEGHPDVVIALLQSGKVNLNHRDYNGNTALIKAAAGCHTQIVKLLLSNDPVSSGRQINSKLGPPDLGTEMIDVNVRGGHRHWTALCHAAHLGDAAMVELLLACPGVVVNESSSFYCDPLALACEQNGHPGEHHRVIEMLLATGKTNINHRYECRLSPLAYAALKNDLEAVKMLIECPEVEVNAVRIFNDRFSVSPFHCALVSGNVEIVRLFLDTGKVDITAGPESDAIEAARHLAAYQHSKERWQESLNGWESQVGLDWMKWLKRGHFQGPFSARLI